MLDPQRPHAVTLSALPHTWLVDIDGTLVKHNGHKGAGDVLLPGVREFWAAIPADDVIILLSSRTEDEKPATLKFLADCGLRYHHALFGLPKGERIVVNDGKPQGLKTAIALPLARDEGLARYAIKISPDL